MDAGRGAATVKPEKGAMLSLHVFLWIELHMNREHKCDYPLPSGFE